MKHMDGFLTGGGGRGLGLCLGFGFYLKTKCVAAPEYSNLAPSFFYLILVFWGIGSPALVGII